MRISRAQEDVGKQLFLFNFLFNHKEQAMNYWRSWYRSALAGVALVAGLGLHATAAFGQAATPEYLAGGTVTGGGISANTDISNTATLTYNVGATLQPVINASTSFKVDKIVNVQVTRIGTAHVSVAPGQVAPNAAVVGFTVTNTGNAIQDYLLTPGNLVNTTQITLPNGTTYTDTFDATGCQAFVDVNNNGVYESGTDNQQAIGSMSPVGGSNSKIVFVVCNIPPAPGLTSGDALVSLLATSHKATTCTVATGVCTAGQNEVEGGADVTTTVQTTLADGTAASPAVPGDAARDGKHSAVHVFRVSNANVTVTKTVVTVCDPFNFTTNPKAVPGARVRYSIKVENFGPGLPSASAMLTQIQDVLNVAFLDFDSPMVIGSASDCTTAENGTNAFKVQCSIATGSGVTNSRPCATAPQYSGSGGPPIVFSTPSITANLLQALPAIGPPATCPATTPTPGVNYCAGELKPGENVTISFTAKIK